MFNGPVNVRYREIRVARLPIEADGLRIAHISDLHLRGFDVAVAEAQARLMRLDYHVLVCTGDLGAYPEPVERTARLCRLFFDPLADRSQCLAILGNHDSERLADCQEIPVRFLRDEWLTVRVGGLSIVVAGLNQASGHHGDVDRALAGAPPDCVAVLLAHYPSAVYRVRDDRVRVVLCGHTHGGQIRFPGIGCLWAHDRIPGRLAWGLHAIHGRSLHVTAGIGVSWPLRFRFLCPPEVVVVTLRRAPGVSDVRRREGDEALAEVAA
ncbi:MAG: metallophosphoesterase family protein [Phycisphaerales bacterium]|nr:MAG: metallophosphoesterase family protein [Phycisphaerales bacterium]